MRFLLLLVFVLSFLVVAEQITVDSGSSSREGEGVIDIGTTGSDLTDGDSSDPADGGGSYNPPDDGGDGSDPTDGDGGYNPPDGDGGSDPADGCGGCGEHGFCNEDTGACVCFDEWEGALCTMPSCGDHGVFSSARDACLCEFGYTGEFCNECGGAPEGEKFVCMGKGGRYHVVPMMTQEAAGMVHLTTLGYHFFEAGSNPEFDCACRPVGSTLGRLPSPPKDIELFPVCEALCPEIFEAFNQIAISQIEAGQVTGSELRDVVRRTNKDLLKCKWETVAPILVVGMVGFGLLTLLCAGIFFYVFQKTKPKKEE